MATPSSQSSGCWVDLMFRLLSLLKNRLATYKLILIMFYIAKMLTLLLETNLVRTKSI